MRRRTAAVIAALLVPAAGASACTSSGAPGPHTSSPTSGSPTSTTTPSTSAPSSTRTSSSSSTPPLGAAARVLAGMNELQRIGQLFMVDCPTSGLADATAQALRSLHVGSVILDGTSSAGRQAIADLTARLRSLDDSPAGLFIATDQEGGIVQRLQGDGFAQIPSAVEQGTIAPAQLRVDAHGWGRQLRGAGVNVDLAPVLDTVPAGFGSNPPIGDLDRQYGSNPAVVASHGVAFARGLADAGVVATVKHFPGLGRVRGNTDLVSGVQDTVTTRHDAYLQPFAQAIRAGVPFVMVSTAIYTQIDPANPAVFSHTVVTDMLRHDLGFRGVIVTDDVGAAAQVSAWPAGQRAVKFIQAGGDMVLTVSTAQVPAMIQAVFSRASADPAFRRLIDAAALRVLRAKQRLGLLG